MLATFGLERLETGLNRDTVSAADVAEFLAQAEAVDVNTLARDGMSRALDRLHERLHGQETTDARRIADSDAPGLPIRLYAQREVNPEFQPTPHAYRV
jgi:hypothetical protein